jgi:hypothetical protein
MTIHDSYYTAPLVRTRASARDDNLDVSETATCDPAGYYRDLRDQGRLDEQLDR